MNYTNKSFSVGGGGSQQYRDNWERTFRAGPKDLCTCTVQYVCPPCSRDGKTLNYACVTCGQPIVESGRCDECAGLPLNAPVKR